MEIHNLKQIISEQKQLGHTPEELLAMAKGAGYQEAMVLPLVVEMFPGFKVHHKEKPDFEAGETLKVWDPAGQSITETRFS